MRTKKQIEELRQQVEQLMMLNHNLSEKVIHLLESNHQILRTRELTPEGESIFLSVANGGNANTHEKCGWQHLTGL